MFKTVARFSDNNYSDMQCKFVIECDSGKGTGNFSWIAGSPSLDHSSRLLETISNHWTSSLYSNKPQYRIVKTSNSEIIKTTES